MDPQHLNGRSRYDPLPPPPHFIDPNYYPPHHLQPPQPPPNNHHPHRHNRDRCLPDDQRLYFRYPHPPDPSPFDPHPHPPPLPRVPDRVLLPKVHPSSRPQAEPFPRESWDGPDVHRFRVFNNRPDPIRPEWEQEPRQGPMPPYRGPPYPLPDAIEGRKRLRWVHDRNLEEDSGGGSQRRLGLEFWDDQRRHHPHHREPAFEQVLPDPSFAGSASSPRGSWFGPVPNRGEGGGGRGEASPLFERRPPPPSLRSVGQSYSDIEVFEKNSALDDHDYQENHYGSNRGKRRLSGGYTQDLVCTPTKQKPSVLSRIQSGKSVWERIEERPAFLSSPSPPHPPPPLPPPSFSEEHAPEMDALDLSYKSNVLVAKVLPSSSPVRRSSDGKGPTSLKTTPKKKVIKKKVAKKKRTRVLVPIVTGLKGPASMEGAPRRPVSTSPHQISGQLVGSPKAIDSFGKPASDASPQSCPKRAVKTASVDKSVAKRSAKRIDFAEGGVIEDARGEGKAASVEEEARKYAEALLSEIIRPTVNARSHLRQQGSTAVTASTEKSAEEQFTGADNSVRADDVKDIREECVTPGEKAGPNCVNSIVSDVVVADAAASLIFAQGATVVMPSLENDAAKGSSKAFALVENELTADPRKQAPQIAEDVAYSEHSDVVFSMSLTKGSPVPGSGNDARVVVSVGSATSSSSGDPLKGKRMKRKREGEEKNQHSKVGMWTERLEIFSGGKSELGDPCLHLSVNGTPAVLPPEVKDKYLDQALLDGGRDDEGRGFSLPVRDGPPESDCTRLAQDHLVVSRSDSIGERMEQPLPFKHSIDSSMVMSKVKDLLQPTDIEQSHQLLDSKGCSNGHHINNQDVKPSSKGDPLLTSKRSFTSEVKEDVKSEKSMLLHFQDPGKAQPLSLDQPKKQITVNREVAGEVTMSRKINLNSGVPRVVPNRVSLAGSIKDTARSNHSARNKTWHRNNTPSSASASHGNLRGLGSSMHKQSPKKLGRPQSSYIRKGNSLIRKSATEVPPPQQSHGLGASSRMGRHVTTRSTGVEIKVDRTDHVTGFNPPFERPKTPPLPLGTKLPNCAMNLPKDIPHPVSENPISEADVKTQARPLEIQTVDLLSGSTDNPSIIIGRKLEPSKTKRMVYVKHKSNQLVAAPGPELGDSSSHHTERAQTLSSFTSSDLYYRRKKNQLVRNSDGPQKQDGMISVDNLNSDDQRISMVSSVKHNTTSLFKKRLDKVLQKTYKHPKFSLVWTLSGEKSHNKGVTSSNHWKVLPQLFPWKRTIFQKNSVINTVSMSNRHSLSLIGRKLQFTRKMDTIYKVSTDGFSLRKAGVLSIGRSSLKWSKSIERHSKKANKEATLAVVEVERKRRERKRSTSVGASGKSGNRLPRERTFRVGSARYKMDSSKRTLIRIPDEQSSCVMDQQSGNNSQTSSVPKRLLIGNDEYIRIGNGNQLVRDPKKLIRILASEKVRWSLHTARLRLARKQQYCQFFTRFGKCNKNEGKCPYIHDPAKVAICTKFIRGLCSNTNCKLTHKVLPERMPDCSYFLRGLCTNISCPYRHVNVNPNASVCEGFLKGYCTDGDECHKKHSYVCPLFEATGTCLQGSKCKLHHPKSRNKSNKRKRPKVQSNSRGRYFGSSITEVGEPLIIASDKHDVEKAGDLFYSDGGFADYICLDIDSYDDGIETNLPMDSQPTQWDSDLSDMQPDDLDVLIKPIRIMNKANLTNTSAGP